jgi:Tfp pilus assembly protein PilZ
MVGVFGLQENTNNNKHTQKFLATKIWPLNPNAMASKMQPFKLLVDNEPKTQHVDLQVEEVLNENLNSPKKASTNITWALIDNVKTMTSN